MKKVKRIPAKAQPWGSSHGTHSGLEADWCGNCREEAKHLKEQQRLRAEERDRL